MKKKRTPWNKGIKTGIVPKSAFKKGNITWCTGKKRPEITGENHFAWKGDEVGYIALHDWVKSKLGKANQCEDCSGARNSKRFEWANISGEYKRELADWKQLCSKCHHEFDDIANKGWTTKKEATFV